MAVDNPKYENVRDGYKKWKEYMNAFGLGVRLGIDLPSEDRGNIPDTAVYNKEYRKHGIPAPILHWVLARIK